MAARKKEDMPNMIETFKEFKDTKKIDRATLVSVLEESFRSVIAKIFGSDENFDVIVNPDKGDFEIYRNRIVVADGEVKDEYKEVSLTDAQKIEPDYEVGEEVSERIDFAKFGRRAILNLRQTLAAKVLELEHDSLYNKYKDRVGQVISSEVYQVWKREVLLVDDENNEDHPLAHGARLPGASAGGRGARDCRRPDRHQERGTHAGRSRQDRRGELRRPHRPGGSLRRCAR